MQTVICSSENSNSSITDCIFNDTSGSYGSNESFTFDGTDDCINLNLLTELNINVGSVSMWWKPVDATPSSGNALFTVASTTVTKDYFTTSTNKTKWWDDITIEQVNIGALIYSAGTQGLSTGDIGPLLIYNRALSALEVSQNYNQLKSRFT